MLSRVALIIGVGLTAAIGNGLVWLTPCMAPIRPGKARDFWLATCGISDDPQGRTMGIGGPVALQGQWLIYSRCHLHGSDLYKVREKQVIAELPWACRKLEEGIVRKQPESSLSKGYLAWKNAKPQDRGEIVGLIERIDAAFNAGFPDTDGQRGVTRYLFGRRLQQANWYWATLLFEFFFLSGLVWFICLPVIMRKKAWRVVLHLALTPVLFMLPAYLGYSTCTFTSRGPSGGVLYPWLLMPCRGHSCDEFDQRLLTYLPQVLEPLSQGTGCPMVLSGAGMPGPTTVLGLGGAVTLMALAVIALRSAFSKITRDCRAACPQPTIS